MIEERVQDVFLVGAKSLGAYGGYETFINKLTEYHQHEPQIRYHVACKANGDGAMDETKLSGVSNVKKGPDGETIEFTYHNARCFKLRIPQRLGPAQAIFYDVKALSQSCRYIREHDLKEPIVYIMACRIGPFMGYFARKIHRLGGRVYLNPDGHEWMRAKWSAPVRKYWKLSERMMVCRSDLVICDSITIEKYIHDCYDGKSIVVRGKNRSTGTRTEAADPAKNITASQNPCTTFIAYGAETRRSRLSDDDRKLMDWYTEKDLTPKDYYLVVGRFVPENNYETMIREFMKSHSPKKFAIITNVNDKFLDELEKKLHFRKDPRICFVGTVYDEELLMKIRENAYAYFHGHEVGGTNPSLLEALGCTDLNLLLDVGFNREVAEEAALYWTKEPDSLASLIDRADILPANEIESLGQQAKKRIRDAYSWQYISDRYLEVFCNQELN